MISCYHNRFYTCRYTFFHRSFALSSRRICHCTHSYKNKSAFLGVFLLPDRLIRKSEHSHTLPRKSFICRCYFVFIVICNRSYNAIFKYRLNYCQNVINSTFGKHYPFVVDKVNRTHKLSVAVKRNLGCSGTTLSQTRIFFLADKFRKSCFGRISQKSAVAVYSVIAQCHRRFEHIGIT